MMSNHTILQTNNLTKHFKNIIAVEDLSLTVEKGDIFGFLGPNGAGKSTTIRMLLGLIRPTRGKIILLNRNLDTNRADILGKIGALVEKPSFYEYLSARRNLELFATLSYNNPDQSDINRVLQIVSLTDRAEHKVKTYSHGMKQRLGIAQALLGNPEMVILDEPTAGLDPKGIKEIRRLIIELAEHGLTIFLSSHILYEVEQMCKNMAIIDKGRMIVQGHVGELLKSKNDTYLVKVDRPEDAARVLRSKEWIGAVKLIDKGLEIEIGEAKVPAMTEILVGQGISIFAIQPQRSLEDYFLSILGTDHV